MAKDDDGLMQIEFESSLESSARAPESVSDGQSSAALPMAIVVLVVGGLLAALVWFSSTTDSTASPEDPPVDEVAPVEEAAPLEESSTNDEPDRDSIIPELSSASIALEPVPLIDPSTATIFGGGFFALAEGSIADELLTPTVFWSVDGVVWEEQSTQALVNGGPNTVGYSWSEIRRSGEGLTVTAYDFDRVRLSFVSTNGVDWEQISTEETLDADKLFFEPVSVADDHIVALSLAGSEILAQFVEDHTTADDVEAACFVVSQAVIGCDEFTEWPFTEETIDSPAGSEAVFSCLNRLSVIGPEITLSRVGRQDSSVEPVDVRIYLTQFLPSVLDDGRVAGVDALSFFGDPSACNGLAAVEEADTEPFYIFDPVTGEVDRLALDPSLNPASTELLGQISATSSDTFLFRSNGRLWTLDFDSGEWTILDTVVFGEQLAFADSGDRIYSFQGSDLSVLDLVVTAGGIEVVETRVYVVLPTDWSNPFVRSAGPEAIVFEAEGSSWLLTVPSGLRCAEQYAEALAGNGLVESC